MNTLVFFKRTHARTLNRTVLTVKSREQERGEGVYDFCKRASIPIIGPHLYIPDQIQTLSRRRTEEQQTIKKKILKIYNSPFR